MMTILALTIKELIFFSLGFIVGTILVVLAIGVSTVGSFQLDMSQKPFIFRVYLERDLDYISNKGIVTMRVDKNWKANREDYIHNVTEKEVDDI